MENHLNKPKEEYASLSLDEDLNDDEFCVGIAKAAELSGLSNSQIRYLESLPGVNLGKKGQGAQ